MKILEVQKEIKEEHLGKDRLEELHTMLSAYLSELSLYKATLEKEKAIFMGYHQDGYTRTSVAQTKIQWEASDMGLKLIGVKGEIEATKPLISSVKSRLYNFL